RGAKGGNRAAVARKQRNRRRSRGGAAGRIWRRRTHAAGFHAASRGIAFRIQEPLFGLNVFVRPSGVCVESAGVAMLAQLRLLIRVLLIRVRRSATFFGRRKNMFTSQPPRS